MAVKYTDQLAEWVKKRDDRRRQDKNTAAFLAVRADVSEALEAGYSMKTIWEHMREQGRIPYRYETFLKHVKRHIKNQKPVVQKQQQKQQKPATRVGGPGPESPEKSTPAEPIRPAKETEKPSRGFTFNKTPNSKDLI